MRYSAVVPDGQEIAASVPVAVLPDSDADTVAEPGMAIGTTTVSVPDCDALEVLFDPRQRASAWKVYSYPCAAFVMV